MDEHDKKWKIEALSMLGININILNELKDSEIHTVWSVLNRFISDITTSNEHNKTMTDVATLLSEGDTICKHENPEYQPAEPENNIHESYNCEDCGIELPLPEPDEDTFRER
tara:strand:- start:430 stop:765 length:336 start_codon:yes stop_codon:yes gene_type:complete